MDFNYSLPSTEEDISENGIPDATTALTTIQIRRKVNLQSGMLNINLSTESVPSLCGSTSTISIRTNVFDELENRCVTQRTEVVKPDGFIVTPLHVVKTMSEQYRTPLHSEVFAINHGYAGYQSKVWRVELFAGHARGIGQAPIRSLAFQVAATDMLEKIKIARLDVHIPVYGLPPGCRISPRVVKDLQQLCRHNNLSDPRITVITSREPFEDTELFEVQCQVGRQTTTAKSDNRYMARRLAARQMYEDLSGGDTYSEMNLALGGDCIGLAQLKAAGIHAVTSTTKQKWMDEHRTGDGFAYTMEDNPDDGDFVESEDQLGIKAEEELGRGRLPPKSELMGLIRVVRNEVSELQNGVENIVLDDMDSDE